MKIQDLEYFQQPIEIELGKVDLFGTGRKVYPIVLRFELYAGKGTYRAKGEEYVYWHCMYLKANGKNTHMTNQLPDYELNTLIDKCGLNPLYRDYIVALRDTYRKNGLKYTRLLPLCDVAKMCDCVKMIEKIAKKQK